MFGGGGWLTKPRGAHPNNRAPILGGSGGFGEVASVTMQGGRVTERKTKKHLWNTSKLVTLRKASSPC